MKRETIKPIVSRRWIKWRLVVIAATIGAIAATVVALVDLRDLRSRAQNITLSPSPRASVPTFTLTPPFMALVTNKSTPGFRESLPLELYIHTNSQNTMEADVVITYDPQIVTIGREDVQTEDVYKSVSIESTEGKLILSFFVRPEIGHAPVKTGFPTKIATLNFKTQTLETNNSAISVLFDVDNEVTSRLIPFDEEHLDKSANILETVSGVEVSVVP